MLACSQVLAMAATWRGASSMLRYCGGGCSDMAVGPFRTKVDRTSANGKRYIATCETIRPCVGRLSILEQLKNRMNPTTSQTAAQTETARLREISFLNLAHALDRFSAADPPRGCDPDWRLRLQRPYSELIALSSTAFVAFGIFALPAGWLADRWSRPQHDGGVLFRLRGLLIAIALAPNLLALSIAMFMLGVFAAIYHPVGMAMLIQASGANGRTLAFNGVCGNLGVSLAAGISGALAVGSTGAPRSLPALVLIASGAVYVWLTPDDRHHVNKRVSGPLCR